MKLTREEQFRIYQAVDQVAASSGRKITSWILITGAPGSGKTTLVDFMNLRGWTTIPDPGRAEYEEQMKSGLTPSELRKEYFHFQKSVHVRFLSNIQEHSPKSRLVLDYGIAESLAFMKLTETPWDNEILRTAAEIQYSHVFILNPVDLKLDQNDIIRTESEVDRANLRLLIGEIYNCLGANITIIPSMPTPDRFALIQSLIDTNNNHIRSSIIH